MSVWGLIFPASNGVDGRRAEEVVTSSAWLGMRGQVIRLKHLSAIKIVSCGCPAESADERRWPDQVGDAYASLTG